MTGRRFGAVSLAALLIVGAGCGGTPPSGAPDPVPPAPTSATSSAVTSPATSASPAPSPATAAPSSPGPTGQTAAPGPTPKPTLTPTQKPTQTACGRLTATLSLRDQVGQLFMVGVTSSGLTDSTARTLDQERAGSAILLGNSTAGEASTRQLAEAVRAAAGERQGVRTMVTVDQEGGRVQRIRGAGFDRIPAARVQAGMSDSQLARDATTWGRQLKRAGIDANLAPVADVVPRDLESVNQPIGVLDRGYGPDPDLVAAKAAAFVRGMDDAGVATAVKHFPGLGRVRGNTDYESHVVDASTTRHDRDLRGFAAGVRAGVDMVMISSAFYTRIDPEHRAAFSPTVIEKMVRGDLGYDGVVISDDLAARAMSDLPPGQRALRFLEAGGDLVIAGDPELAAPMIRAVTSRASSDPDFAADVTQKATRVVTMKAHRGLADCG